MVIQWSCDVWFQAVPGIQCSVVPLNRLVSPKPYLPWLKLFWVHLGQAWAEIGRSVGSKISPGFTWTQVTELLLSKKMKNHLGNMQYAKLLMGSDKIRSTTSWVTRMETSMVTSDLNVHEFKGGIPLNASSHFTAPWSLESSFKKKWSWQNFAKFSGGCRFSLSSQTFTAAYPCPGPRWSNWWLPTPGQALSS